MNEHAKDHLEDQNTFAPFKNNLLLLKDWILAHKLKSFFLVIALFIVVEAATIPWFDVPTLRTENPEKTALMRQRIREAESDNKNLVVKQKWVRLSQIPRSLVNAVVVAEDGRFWQHDGFDWYEFRKSMEKNWEKKGAVRGASTITQQLAKNLYLSTSKDPVRKLKEWMITILLEHYLDKNRIMEIYLNVIEWGNGIFGAEAAAQAYFGRSAASLSFDQVLRLAAVIPSPRKHRASDNTRYVLWRKKMVLVRIQGRDYAEPEVDDDEPDQTLTEQSQDKEASSNQQPQEDSNNTSVTAPLQPLLAMPVPDSTDIDKGDSNDVQRRKPTN